LLQQYLHRPHPLLHQNLQQQIRQQVHQALQEQQEQPEQREPLELLQPEFRENERDQQEEQEMQELLQIMLRANELDQQVRLRHPIVTEQQSQRQSQPQPEQSSQQEQQQPQQQPHEQQQPDQPIQPERFGDSQVPEAAGEAPGSQHWTAMLEVIIGTVLSSVGLVAPDDASDVPAARAIAAAAAAQAPRAAPPGASERRPWRLCPSARICGDGPFPSYLQGLPGSTGSGSTASPPGRR